MSNSTDVIVSFLMMRPEILLAKHLSVPGFTRKQMMSFSKSMCLLSTGDLCFLKPVPGGRIRSGIALVDNPLLYKAVY